MQLLPRRLVEDVLLLPTTCYDYQDQQQLYCRDLSGWAAMMMYHRPLKEDEGVTSSWWWCVWCCVMCREGGMRKLVDP